MKWQKRKWQAGRKHGGKGLSTLYRRKASTTMLAFHDKTGKSEFCTQAVTIPNTNTICHWKKKKKNVRSCFSDFHKSFLSLIKMHFLMKDQLVRAMPYRCRQKSFHVDESNTSWSKNGYFFNFCGNSGIFYLFTAQFWTKCLNSLNSLHIKTFKQI